MNVNNVQKWLPNEKPVNTVQGLAPSKDDAKRLSRASAGSGAWNSAQGVAAKVTLTESDITDRKYTGLC